MNNLNMLTRPFQSLSTRAGAGLGFRSSTSVSVLTSTSQIPASPTPTPANCRRRHCFSFVKGVSVTSISTPRPHHRYFPRESKSRSISTSSIRRNSNDSSGKVKEPLIPTPTATATPTPVSEVVVTAMAKTESGADSGANAAAGDGAKTSALLALAASETDKINASPKKKRKLTSMDRNFITPVRAMQDFLLKTNDLHGLRKTVRRSPHADEPPIMVYWRRDVEQRAEEIWGTFEELKKEKQRRGHQNEEYLEALTDVKRILYKYRKEYSKESASSEESSNLSPATTLLTGSGRIVLTAITINGANFVIKILAWSMTGSHSLFAEAIHSLADTINQVILAYGIHKSTQRANYDHPYGYANMRHVASLISGVGIFCVGAGLSFYHGITGLISMEPIESLYWAFYVLAGSLVSEGATLYLAANSVRKRAKALNISFKDFIMRGRDPSLNVVLLEDAAAVSGVAVASICMGISMYTNSPIADSVGSLVIGGLLGGVASFIIYSNSAALVGRSIPRENLDEINAELEQDVMIRAIHDVKGIDMGNTKVRYKAEVDFDGRELTRSYLDKQDVNLLLAEIKGVNSNEDLENFLLKHGENIVDTLGAEIDRIETKLKTSHPEIRHCDLEIL